MQNPNNLIWIDLEMTGLEPERDVIIEMATIVTDSELNVLAEGPVIAIHQSDEALAGMDEWNTRTHGQSGLTQRVRESKIDTAAAERDAERSPAASAAASIASPGANTAGRIGTTSASEYRRSTERGSPRWCGRR